MGLTVAEREHQRFAEILSRFGFSDTEDVPLSAVLQSALSSLTAEIDALRAARAAGSGAPRLQKLATEVRQLIRDRRVVSLSADRLMKLADDIAAAAPEPSPRVLTPEAMAAELERGHYSILRSALAVRGSSVAAQIMLEELCTLVREAVRRCSE